MRLTYTINSEAVAGELAAKGDTLMDALEEAMGLAGESLYEAIMFNMSGGIIQSRTGLLASSVRLNPVIRSGRSDVISVSAEIPDTGSFEHLVGMVLEFGGTHAYEIVPLESRFWEQLGLFKGAGKESMFSQEAGTNAAGELVGESIALTEGRLPHSLAWVGEGGGTVFAKRVNHPPSREFAFMRTSLDEVKETVRFQITEAIAAAVAA